MIKAVQKELEPYLADHDGAVGLFLSGGADSVLLLNILLDVKAVFTCVSLDHTFSPEQRLVVDALIEKHGLRVFKYAPARMYLIGDGRKKVSLVEEYALPMGVMPFLRDCRHDGTKCVYDAQFNGEMQLKAPIGFTLNLFGTRRTDRHFATGKVWKEKLAVRNGLTFLAPLWNFTKQNIIDGLASFGTQPPSIDTGELELCLSCITATKPVRCPQTRQKVEPFVWQPIEMLGAFRQRFEVA